MDDYNNMAEQVVLLARKLNEQEVPLAGRRIRISEACARSCFSHLDITPGSRLFGFDVVEVAGSETVVYLGDRDEKKVNASGSEPPDYPVTPTMET